MLQRGGKACNVISGGHIAAVTEGGNPALTQGLSRFLGSPRILTNQDDAIAQGAKAHCGRETNTSRTARNKRRLRTVSIASHPLTLLPGIRWRKTDVQMPQLGVQGIW
jgi:hypothetical protein